MTCIALQLTGAPAQAQRDKDSPAELWKPIPLASPERDQQPSGDTRDATREDGPKGQSLLLVLSLAMALTGFAIALRVGPSRPRAAPANRGPPASGEAIQGGEATQALRLRRLAGPVTATLALAVVEVVLAYGHVLAAQIADAILVALFASAGRGRREREPATELDARVGAMRALALIALIRVVGIGLPLGEISALWREGLMSIVIGVAALRAAPAIGVAVRELFALPTRRIQWSTGLGGLALGFGAYLCGAPELVPPGAETGRILFAAAVVMVAALVEEFVFRGLLQLSLQRLVGGLFGLAAPALFACSYISFGSVSLVLVITLAGLLFAYSVTASGVLGGAIVGHALFTVGAAVVWPALLGPEPPLSPPEPATRLFLTAAVIIGAVVLARHSVWPVARPSTTQGDGLPSLERTLIAEKQRI